MPGTAWAQKVALVIANSDYEHTSQLANPEADSVLVAGALRQIGFDTVELASNLDQPEFMAKLRDFRELADGADAALVYYAGHGVESKGRNWLLPTSATLAAEKDMPFEAIELGRVLDTLEGARLRIAILDACRNNPFASRWQGDNRSISRGLAPLEVDDMLVIYAAAPGAFAFDGADGNSPFALALARRIVQPGLPVQLLGGMVRDDVLEATDGEQRPFISASMTGQPLFLVDGPDTQMQWLASLNSSSPSNNGQPELVNFASATDAIAAGRGITAAEHTLLNEKVWLEALAQDSVQSYRAYLTQFPEGAYASFAKANIAQLLDPTATGGELNSDKPWIISLGAALPGRYAIDLGAPLPIDGVWRISTNDKRLRIERGRAFAVDGWNHALLFRVEPEQVTMTDMRREAAGSYLGRDILLNGDAQLTLRADGNLGVKVSTFPFPVEFVLIREALDDPATLEEELPAMSGD
ncbi:caspase family protein [uncultured Erythrobacter sp.]|uniref:caspase family protein n=1 Tax=uncultured Erythrobacter sp. TaxID=263913 RepID=UPI002637441D|nr:caspase family protein [uncultured Erythrobacter sp.]